MQHYQTLDIPHCVPQLKINSKSSSLTLEYKQLPDTTLWIPNLLRQPPNELNVLILLLNYSFSQLCLISLTEVLLDPCRTWCPSSSCQAVCQLQESGPQSPQLVQCKVCDIEFCSACKSNWHPGQGCQENMPVSFLPGETRYKAIERSACVCLTYY